MSGKIVAIGITILSFVVMVPFSQATGKEHHNSTEVSFAFNNKEYQFRSAEKDVFLFFPSGEEIGDDWTEQISIITVPGATSPDHLMQVAATPSSEQHHFGDLVGIGGDAQTSGPPKEILLYFEKEYIGAIEFSTVKLLVKDGMGVLFTYTYRVMGASAQDMYSKLQETNAVSINQAMKEVSTQSIFDAIAIMDR